MTSTGFQFSSSRSFYVISCLDLPNLPRKFPHAWGFRVHTDGSRGHFSAPLSEAAGIWLHCHPVPGGATIFRLENVMFPNVKIPYHPQVFQFVRIKLTYNFLKLRNAFINMTAFVSLLLLHQLKIRYLLATLKSSPRFLSCVRKFGSAAFCMEVFSFLISRQLGPFPWCWPARSGIWLLVLSLCYLESLTSREMNWGVFWVGTTGILPYTLGITDVRK